MSTRLAIRHETLYRYSRPVSYTIQILRLTPRPMWNQRILDWSIDAPGRRSRHVDAYGNVTHTLVVSEPHSSIRLIARGVVEIAPVPDGRIEDDIATPVQAFLVDTPLTKADASIRDFARQALPDGLRNPRDALMLAQAICERVVYQSGVTEVHYTASQALALGQGVCQDHAHLFLAASREMGVPARYVSGFLDPGVTDYAASHAWVDVWFPAEQWVSIDVTHAKFASDRHCRFAVGRDYDSACPVRGVRTGGGQESMEVKVIVKRED